MEGTLREACPWHAHFLFLRGILTWITSAESSSFTPAAVPWLVEVEPEALKYFPVGSPASVRKKNKKKKNTKRGDENGDNSATKTVEEPIDLTDPISDGDDGDIVPHAPLQSLSANFEKLSDMKKMMVDERKKVDAKLEQVLNDFRKKADVELERALDDFRKKADDDRKKARTESEAMMSELAENFRRLGRKLDAVRETVNDNAEWIATGCPEDGEVLQRIRIHHEEAQKRSLNEQTQKY